jgi:hypothetical protein
MDGSLDRLPRDCRPVAGTTPVISLTVAESTAHTATCTIRAQPETRKVADQPPGHYRWEALARPGFPGNAPGHRWGSALIGTFQAWKPTAEPGTLLQVFHAATSAGTFSGFIPRYAGYRDASSGLIDTARLQAWFVVCATWSPCWPACSACGCSC